MAPRSPSGRSLRASFAQQTYGFYLDCMFIWSALGVSYITGFAAITERTKIIVALKNREIHSSLL